MKKYLIAVTLFIGCLLIILPSVVNAQDFTQQFKTFALFSGAGEGAPTDPRIVVAQIVKLILGVVGIMFFAYSVYAGYLILSSAGDEDKIKRGKSTLRTGVLGIFVAMSAYSILALVAGTALRATESKPGAYFDYDSNTEEYDFCTNGAGDPVSCGTIR